MTTSAVALPVLEQTRKMENLNSYLTTCFNVLTESFTEYEHPVFQGATKVRTLIQNQVCLWNDVLISCGENGPTLQTSMQDEYNSQKGREDLFDEQQGPPVTDMHNDFSLSTPITDIYNSLSLSASIFFVQISGRQRLFVDDDLVIVTGQQGYWIWTPGAIPVASGSRAIIDENVRSSLKPPHRVQGEILARIFLGRGHLVTSPWDE
ncbi:hypothetical protein TARUN_836 [Trichoderma arundinaceum]|uniref:Uncharacterized protein n=1 Tax=Trichoderma arundinaceum TaxID=490622 RepID=A0A395P032_TRIAR|nr:hypothetical protein TARUN_836 [Trichoderma arundinaceum]